MQRLEARGFFGAVLEYLMYTLLRKHGRADDRDTCANECVDRFVRRSRIIDCHHKTLIDRFNELEGI